MSKDITLEQKEKTIREACALDASFAHLVIAPIAGYIATPIPPLTKEQAPWIMAIATRVFQSVPLTELCKLIALANNYKDGEQFDLLWVIAKDIVKRISN
jgi:hypothetical protein